MREIMRQAGRGVLESGQCDTELLVIDGLEWLSGLDHRIHNRVQGIVELCGALVSVLLSAASRLNSAAPENAYACEEQASPERLPYANSHENIVWVESKPARN